MYVVERIYMMFFYKSSSLERSIQGFLLYGFEVGGIKFTFLATGKVRRGIT